MGMPISIHLRGPATHSARAVAVVQDALTSLRDADRLFSTYRDDSDISRIRAGVLDPAEADPAVHEVRALCDRASQETDGAFTAHLPGADGRRGFDPTGLVKGWAVERACRHLDALAGHSYCINAGGDVAVGGPGSEPSTPWRVGIEDPADRGRIARVVDIVTGGAATSGAAARGAHIYDSDRRAYVAHPGSVTVIGPSLLCADVWATALYVGPAHLAARLPEGYELIRL